VTTKVCIVQARLHHFRVPFYGCLRQELATAGIELVLVHGDASPHERGQEDSGRLEWAIRIKNRSAYIGKTELLWQPCLKHVNNCELVIIQQENRMLVNYWLLFRKNFTNQKLAFWGHGTNCQSGDRSSFKEGWKRLFIGLPHWWFAYTDLTKNILLAAGYPQDRITVVQNAIDTERLRQDLSHIADEDVIKARNQHGIEGASVGIYCGSIYKHKRIGFLLEACTRIRKEIRCFELVILGTGPDVEIIRQALPEKPWIHYIGPQFGRDKALFLKMAHVFLMPSAVGLCILDAFAAGLPLIAIRDKFHGPEIAYLKHEHNGFLTANTQEDYCKAVLRVLRDQQLRSRLSRNCLYDSKRYSIDYMAHNFARGVLGALA